MIDAVMLGVLAILFTFARTQILPSGKWKLLNGVRRFLFQQYFNTDYITDAISI